jgi:hypothetical protein
LDRARVLDLEVVLLTRYISNSELRSAKGCMREWYFATHLKLRPKRDKPIGPAAIGDKLHVALNRYYTDEGDPLEYLADRLKEELEQYPDQKKDLLREGKLTRVMMEGYLEWLEETGADADLVVLSSEEEVQVPLEHSRLLYPVVLVGKLDLRYLDQRSGRTAFMDHKSVGSFADKTALIHMDEQLLHYHLLEFLKLRQAGSTDEVTNGGTFNMLQKVLRTASATPPFYSRVSTWHNITELRSYFKRVIGTIRRIQDAEVALAAGEDHHFVVAPYSTRDCRWKCDFLPLCPLVDDEMSDSGGMIEERYEVGNPYQRYQTLEGEHAQT